ncbi:MAG: glycoside hydrolase family 15 protein [Bdellovibrionales bacterium]|nr:glycoside hydrolase family 15 protein [Bdellovibrionales bacterium]
MSSLLLTVLLLSVPAAQAKHTAVDPYSRQNPRHEKRYSYRQWMELQEDFAMEAFEAHSHLPDGLPGSVIASPERGDPDYYYHWVRDGALVMNTLSDFRERGVWNPSLIERYLKEYADVSRLHQLEMHQPKFYVDGRPYTGEWCRPQNDGPALRALVLIRLARVQLAKGNGLYVRDALYDGKLPARTLIKGDLEFVAHHWRDPSCDLWEEYYGDHFYTRMVQRKALVEGARLAEQLGDRGAADYYRQQAKDIEIELLKHWDAVAGIFRVTRNYRDGASVKADGIDTAVVLAFLHGYTDDGFLKFSDPRVLSTLDTLTAHFRKLYAINQQPGIAGVGIGRYTDDDFNGQRGHQGNPWFLLTAAMGQAYLRAAEEIFDEGGSFKRAFALYRKGDSFFRRLHYHAKGGEVLDEQFDRHTGEMLSAPDLAWSNKETADGAHVWKNVRRKLNTYLKSCGADLSASRNRKALESIP